MKISSRIRVDDSTYPANTVLSERYRIISLLGEGGMGLVYKVEQIFLGKELALKTIHKHLLHEQTMLRFQAEARAAFSVDHPNIIDVHDFGMLEDGTPFLVMELLKGRTLSSLLKERRLALDEAITIFIQVCLGLAHAHAKGVVHRDIKPSNIMLIDQIRLGVEGSVKILDFGIAKMTQLQDETVQSLTQTGEIFGSPLYMSPEQCLGLRVDHRADIYSLGCLIFEALTGTPPFVGDTALSTMMMHQSAPAPSLKEASLGVQFPAALETIMQKMLLKSPEQRYQSLENVAFDLASLRQSDKAVPLTEKEKSKRRAALLKSQSVNDTKSGVITMRRDTFLILLSTLSLFSFLVTLFATHYVRSSSSVSTKVSEKLTEVYFPVESAAAFTEAKARHDVRYVLQNDGDDSALEGLKNCSYVQSLNMEGTNVTDAGIANLFSSNILRLLLHKCHDIKSTANISKLKTLRELDLSETDITDRDIKPLLNLKRLSTLNLKGCKLSEDAIMQLAASHSLTSVVLDEHSFKRSFVESLAAKMPQCIFPGFTIVSAHKALSQADSVPAGMERSERVSNYFASHRPLDSLGGISLAEVANYKQAAAQYAEANSLRTRAMKIFETNGDQRLLGYTLIPQACLQIITKPTEAMRTALRAQEILLENELHDGSDLQNFLYALVQVPIGLKSVKAADEMCQISLDFLNRYRPKDHLHYALVYERMAQARFFVNDKPNAFSLYDKSLAEAKLDNHPNSVLATNILLESGFAAPTIELSRKRLLEGMAAAEAQGLKDVESLPERYAAACALLSRIESEQGNKDESVQIARRGLEHLAAIHRSEVDKYKETLRQRVAEGEAVQKPK